MKIQSDSPSLTARNRALRTWYGDGLTELAVGLMSSLQGGWLLLIYSGNSGSSWHEPLILISSLLLIVIALCASRIMTAVRSRLVYPRAGYVDFGKTVSSRWIVTGTIVAVLAISIGLLTLRKAGYNLGDNAAFWQRWVLLASGLVIGASSIFIGVRQRLPRFLALGAVGMFLCVVADVALPPTVSTAMFLALFGCALLCSGGVTLRRFLRVHPQSIDET